MWWFAAVYTTASCAFSPNRMLLNPYPAMRGTPRGRADPGGHWAHRDFGRALPNRSITSRQRRRRGLPRLPRRHLFEGVCRAAARFGIGPTRLARGFTDEFGIPPRAYVVTRRLKVARDRILDGAAVRRCRDRGRLLRSGPPDAPFQAFPGQYTVPVRDRLRGAFPRFIQRTGTYMFRTRADRKRGPLTASVCLP